MRILRQLSLEDVARATRIGVARLADLEADEYSNFPNVAYAKGFLRSYGSFLNVDLKTYLDGFEDGTSFGLDDYQYLSEKPVGEFRVQRRPQQRPRIRRQRVVFVTSLCGVFAVAFFVWFLYRTYQRLGDLDKLAERQEARAHGSLRPGAESPAATRPMIPVSATPLPSRPSPAPESTPASSDSMGRELVALTLAEHSPSAPLSQLAASAANFPMLPGSDMPGGDAHHSLALRAMMQKPLLLGSPDNPVSNATDLLSALPFTSGGDDRRIAIPASNKVGSGNLFYVHMLDKNSVDVFRTGVPRPPKPAGNSLD